MQNALMCFRRSDLNYLVGSKTTLVIEIQSSLGQVVFVLLFKCFHLKKRRNIFLMKQIVRQLISISC